MIHVVVSEFMDRSAVDSLAQYCKVSYLPQAFENDALQQVVVDADALIVRNRSTVSQQVLDAAPNLQIIGRLGVGLDNIDMTACAARNIKVVAAKGANDQSVVEYTLAAMLMLLRSNYASTDAVRAGMWPRQAFIGQELQGKVLGLVGFGAIARKLTHAVSALGVSVAAYDPYITATEDLWRGVRYCADLPTLLEQADIVSIHLPLTEQTQGLFDAHAVHTMKRGAFLINTSRGGIVDEHAVAKALKANHLGGAAFDVFVHEPLDADAGACFQNVPNLLLTPHVAGVTQESNQRVSDYIATEVAAHFGYTITH